MSTQRRTSRTNGRPAGRPSRRVRTSAAPSAATTATTQRSGAREQRGPRLTGRAAVLFLVLLVLLISYASSLRAWLQQRDDTAQARAEIAQSRQHIAELEDRKQRLDDPAYIKSLARDQFGWVMPGETGYTVLDDNGDVLGSSGGLSEPESASSSDQRQWYSTLWGSVRSSGDESDGDSADDNANPGHQQVVRPRGYDR